MKKIFLSDAGLVVDLLAYKRDGRLSDVVYDVRGSNNQEEKLPSVGVCSVMKILKETRTGTEIKSELN